MSVLGRGRFSRVVAEETGRAEASASGSGLYAVKIIDVDAQAAPHCWRAEVAALRALGRCANVAALLAVDERLARMEPEVRLRMPRYAHTLEGVVLHHAKANYPPGSGWRNALPAARARAIFAGLCRALAAAHALGIVHRDVKPENIMFASFDSEPVLIDFGVAWVPAALADGAAASGAAANGGSVSGEAATDKVTDVCTGEYKAPELLFGRRAYGAPVDMWAAGCVLALLLSQDCRPPFAPFRSDIALIGAQFAALGRPVLRDCPSLQCPLVESLLAHVPPAPAPHTPQPGQAPALSLRPIDAALASLVTALLDYEPTRRPTAEQALAALGESMSHAAPR